MAEGFDTEPDFTLDDDSLSSREYDAPRLVRSVPGGRRALVAVSAVVLAFVAVVALMGASSLPRVPRVSSGLGSTSTYSTVDTDTCQRTVSVGLGTASDGTLWAYPGPGTNGDFVVNSPNCQYLRDAGEAASLGSAFQQGYMVALVTPAVVSDVFALQADRVDANNLYRLESNGTNWEFIAVHSGTQTVTSLAATTLSTSVATWVQFDVEGCTLAAKWWATGTTAPANYLYSWVDTGTCLGAGTWGVFANSASSTVKGSFTQVGIYSLNAVATPTPTVTGTATATPTPTRTPVVLTPVATATDAPLCGGSDVPSSPGCTAPTPTVSGPPPTVIYNGDPGGGGGSCGNMPGVNLLDRNSWQALLQWEGCEVANGDTTDAPVIGGVVQGMRSLAAQFNSALGWMWAINNTVGGFWSDAVSNIRGIAGGVGSVLNAPLTAIQGAVNTAYNGMIGQLTTWLVPSSADTVPLQTLIHDMEARQPFATFLSMGKLLASLGAYVEGRSEVSPALGTQPDPSGSFDNMGCASYGTSSTPGSVPVFGTPGGSGSVGAGTPAPTPCAVAIATPGGALQPTQVAGSTLTTPSMLPPSFNAQDPSTYVPSNGPANSLFTNGAQYSAYAQGVQIVVNFLAQLGMPAGFLAKLMDAFLVLAVMWRCLRDLRISSNGGDGKD